MVDIVSTDWTDNFSTRLFEKTTFPIQDLPDKLLIQVFSLLPTRESVENCMLVCKSWHDSIKRNEDALKQRHSIDVSLDGDHGLNLSLYVDFMRKGLNKTVLLTRDQPRPGNIFKTSIISRLSFNVQDPTVQQFRDDLESLMQLGGHRMTVKDFRLTLSGFVFRQIGTVLGTVARCIDVVDLSISMSFNLAAFQEFFTDSKAMFLFMFEEDKKIKFSLSYGSHGDAADWNDALDDSFEKFFGAPFKKSHISLSLWPITEAAFAYKDSILLAIVEKFKEVAERENFFGCIDLQHHFESTPFGALLPSTGFVYVRTINDGVKKRVYRLNHPSLNMVLEATTSSSQFAHQSSWSIKCVELPPEISIEN